MYFIDVYKLNIYFHEPLLKYELPDACSDFYQFYA